MLVSARDLWRELRIDRIASCPGVLVQIAGEYAFWMGTGTLGFGRDISACRRCALDESDVRGISDCRQSSLFVTIVLLTVGAIAAYRTKHYRGAEQSNTAAAIRF